MNKRRGRPPRGHADGRDRILAVSGPLFLANGYAHTTLRDIAEAAHCDVALISYHFGSKKGLFAHAMALEIAPAAVMESAAPGDPQSLGTRLLTHVVAALERPDVAMALTELVRLAMLDEQIKRSFVEYLDREIFAQLVERLGGAEARARATSILTLIVGAIFGRYILQIPGLADHNAQGFLTALQPASRAAAQPLHRHPR